MLNIEEHRKITGSQQESKPSPSIFILNSSSWTYSAISDHEIHVETCVFSMHVIHVIPEGLNS